MYTIIVQDNAFTLTGLNPEQLQVFALMICGGKKLCGSSAESRAQREQEILVFCTELFKQSYYGVTFKEDTFILVWRKEDSAKSAHKNSPDVFGFF